jgi:hypothetical protein
MSKLAILALLTASVLQAGDTKYGLQATLSFPQSDLGDTVNNKMGYGIGAHMLFDLDNGHAIMPRLDYQSYSGTSDNFWEFKADTKITAISLGAEYNYFFSGKANQGAYIGGGLNFGNFKIEGTTTEAVDLSYYGINATAKATAKASKSLAYFSICGGYAFTPNITLGLRYWNANVSSMEYEFSAGGYTSPVKETDDKSHSGSAIDLSLMIRF